MSQLLNLLKGTDSLARTAPDLFAQPEVAWAVEQAFMYAIIACMTDGDVNQRHAVNSYHQTVLARFEELLAARDNAPLHLAEVCAAIGAPERTLRACCEQHLGMGPIRYLRLRRMHLAHRALLEADATSATVTSIATDQGFWELGKFSVAYRSLFGESPSATLRRRPVHQPMPKISALCCHMPFRHSQHPRFPEQCTERKECGSVPDEHAIHPLPEYEASDLRRQTRYI
jgi:AraC-like DNA-binding protein